MSLVDVVIVSYNSRARLRACVEPLVGVDGVEVFVADNASPDGSLEAIRDLPVTAIQLDTNGGFAHGCNAGAHVGSSPYVLFLNPDARIDAESLRSLVSALEQDPSAGAAAPRIVHSDGSLDWSQRRFPRSVSTFAQALFLHRVFPRASWTDELVREAGEYERPATPDWVSGAAVLVRRSAFSAVGGFDDGFFMYCEDMDLCRRLWDAGWRIRFVPSATVWHEGGASAPRAALLPTLASSRVRYARKHRGRAAAALERGGIALGSLTHILAGRGGAPARAGHARSLRVALIGR